MKVLKITVVAICLIAFSSCRDNTNRTTQDRLDDNTTTLDRTTRDDNTMTNRDNNVNSTQVDRTGPEMTRLYTELNMSPEQIQEFERRESEHRNNMDANNAQNQTQADLDRRRDQYLREILNNEQYQRYEQWKLDNPNRTSRNSGN